MEGPASLVLGEDCVAALCPLFPCGLGELLLEDLQVSVFLERVLQVSEQEVPGVPELFEKSPVDGQDDALSLPRDDIRACR